MEVSRLLVVPFCRRARAAATTHFLPLADPSQWAPASRMKGDLMRSTTTLPWLTVAAIAITAGCQTAEPVPEYDGRNLYLGYCAPWQNAGAAFAGNGLKR